MRLLNCCTFQLMVCGASGLWSVNVTALVIRVANSVHVAAQNLRPLAGVLTARGRTSIGLFVTHSRVPVRNHTV